MVAPDVRRALSGGYGGQDGEGAAHRWVRGPFAVLPRLREAAGFGGQFVSWCHHQANTGRGGGPGSGSLGVSR